MSIFLATFVSRQRGGYAQTGNSTYSNCIDPVAGRSSASDLSQNIQDSQRYMLLHQVAQAIPCLQNAHALDPTNNTVAYDLGLAYLQSDETMRARALVQSQLKIQNRAEFHDLLGAIATKQQHFHEAATQYQIAAQQDPSEQNIFDYGTSLLNFQGDSAEKIFRYGVAKYPGSVRLHAGLGSALYAQGQSTQAAQEMCAAARLDPSDPHPMEMIGATEQIPPSLAGEITARFADQVRLHPRNGTLIFYYAMARSGMWSGQATAAPQSIELLHRALLLDPHLTKAYFYLAQIEEQKKQYKEAIQNYRRATELDPGDAQYLYRLAFAYKEEGDDAMFQKELKRFRLAHNQAKKTE